MQKIGSFLVNKRLIILIIMAIVSIVSSIFIFKVEINSDLTKYLADDSDMRKGIDIMNAEFPPLEMPNTMRVMFVDLKDSEKTEALARLKKIKNVKSVSYDDSESYNKDNYTLFILTTDCEYGSQKESSLINIIELEFSGKKVYCHNDNTGIGDFPTVVLLIAMGLLIVILLIMCGSWFEPVLFLAVIGIAVLINLGTNIFLGSISNVTFSIAAILQLVLSMDYSIILMNRYRQERKLTADKTEAMKIAVTNSIPSIFSSAFTTIVGLLMLLFMSFKIGLDLGLVLAKGVFISMICVFTILPSFILFCDKILLKTEKKGRFIRKARGESGEKRSLAGTLANVSYKGKYILVGVFAALFVAVSVLQTFTPIKYNLETEDPIAEVFATSNPIVLVYETSDEKAVSEIAAETAKKDKVNMVISYGETLGKQFTAAELPGGVSEMLGLMSALGAEQALPDSSSVSLANLNNVLNEDLIKLVYYYGRDGESRPLTLSEYASALENLSEQALFSMLFDTKTKRGVSEIRRLANDSDDAEHTAEDLLIKANSATSAIADDILQIGLLYGSTKKYLPENATASVAELFDWLYNGLTNDKKFDRVFTALYKSMLKNMKKSMDDASALLRGEKYSRLIINTVLPPESPETTAFFDELTQKCGATDGDYYLIGNSAMNYEMAKSFNKELILITVLTVCAIFLVVLFSFRNILIPVILALLVQAGVFVMVSCLISYGVFYLALLIVECILMGATIDYGILFTNFYREHRKTQSVKDALKKAYGGAMHTILTSGSILVLITGIIGILSSDPTMSQICIAISVGALSATLIILFILPGLLAVFDKPVMMTIPFEKLLDKLKRKRKSAPTEAEELAPEIAAEEDSDN